MNDIFKNVLASSSAVSISVGIFNPLDCLRIRWQVTNDNGNFKNYLNKIYKREGLIKGLWKPGLKVNILASGFSRGIGIGLYPYISKKMSNKFNDKKKNFSIMFSSGLISGGFGYLFSNPLWVLKTRMQADLEIKKYFYKNISGGFKSLIHDDGYRGLYRGFRFLALRGAFMNGGNTLGYDGTKSVLKNYIGDNPYLHLISSFNASILSTTFSTPLDYLMTKSQTGVKKHGNIFRGWLPMFIRILPIYCLYLPLYEQIRLFIGLGYL